MIIIMTFSPIGEELFYRGVVHQAFSVENYPGLPPMSGAALVQRLREHLERFDVGKALTGLAGTLSGLLVKWSTSGVKLVTDFTTANYEKFFAKSFFLDSLVNSVEVTVIAIDPQSAPPPAS